MSDLADLLAHLHQAVETLSPEEAPGVIGALEAVKSKVWMRMFRLNGQPQPSESDRLLTVKEAADRLGISRDWVYRHAEKLPFTVRLGSRLLFSAQGIERYIRQRQGRN